MDSDKFAQGLTGIVTADNWFKGYNGNQFKHVAGPIYYFEAKEMMGFVPKESANWGVLVGDIDREDHGIQQIIAGCQVHYVQIVSAEKIDVDDQNTLDLTLTS